MTPQRLDAVIVGAGFGGIGAAIQLRRLGYDNFVDPRARGRPRRHLARQPLPRPRRRHPVDRPTRTRSSRTRTGRGCSPPARSSRGTPTHVADKYDVRRHMRFGTSVRRRPLGRGRRDCGMSPWRTVKRSAARFLLTATGFLSQPNTPDIAGIEDFDGRDHPHHRLGRRLRLHGQAESAMIGTGATAVQLIPKLAEAGRRPDRLPTHADLCGAEARLSHRRGRCGDSSVEFRSRTVPFAG